MTTSSSSPSQTTDSNSIWLLKAKVKNATQSPPMQWPQKPNKSKRKRCRKNINHKTAATSEAALSSALPLPCFFFFFLYFVAHFLLLLQPSSNIIQLQANPVAPSCERVGFGLVSRMFIFDFCAKLLGRQPRSKL